MKLKRRLHTLGMLPGFLLGVLWLLCTPGR